MNTFSDRDYILELEAKSLRQDERDEEERHKRLVKEIALRRKEFQARCTHAKSKYYPDASGNNGGFTECLICGADL